MFHASVSGQPVSPPAPQPVAELIGLVRGVVGLPGLLLPGVPRGDGGVVRVLPGYLTGDATTVALRAYLRALGYRPHGWGLGVNTGDVERYASAVAAIVAKDVRRSGRPVRIVGWSLGGVIGREVARRCPADVRQVVTLGSPIVGGPKYTLAAASYAADGWDLERIAAVVALRNAEPMPVPVTAIYSKDDSVVAWQACLDPNPASPTRHVEVGGKHAELGVSAPVLRLVGRALAAGR
jgi:pimeloyl-ACP methyl ester carboxylesterase